MNSFRSTGQAEQNALSPVASPPFSAVKNLAPRLLAELARETEYAVQRAKGYRAIMVNGEITFDQGQPTGATRGKLLRHGRA